MGSHESESHYACANCIAQEDRVNRNPLFCPAMEAPLKKLAALIVVAMFAMQYGCNRDSASVVKSGGSANTIGVVDPERVARARGWSDQVENNGQASENDARAQVGAHLAVPTASCELTE